jgi:hypothetical protein
MISDGLRSAYAERGIRLIRSEDGARSLLDELRQRENCESEVVLTCTPQRIAHPDAPRA